MIEKQLPMEAVFLLKTENFVIAVFHFCIVYDSQKWTAVTWQLLPKSKIWTTAQ